MIQLAAWWREVLPLRLMVRCGLNSAPGSSWKKAGAWANRKLKRLGHARVTATTPLVGDEFWPFTGKPPRKRRRRS